MAAPGNHLAAAHDLAAALDQWIVGAEPGERSPYARIAVVAGSQLLTRHELTRRQAGELTALIADVVSIASAPWSLLDELRRFAGPTDRASVTVIIEEIAAAPAGTVGFSAQATGHLTELLGYGLTERATARQLIARESPYQAGQRIQLRPGETGPAGPAGTISHITVSWPDSPDRSAELRFHVHVDASDSDLPHVFTVAELGPLPGTAPGRRLTHS